MTARKQQNGFTIIEVVLVLAIAALIFLMIFVALPALQRGQRDTARKQDANTVAAAINTYRSNHSGQLPSGSAFNGFVTQYVTKLAQYGTDNVKVADTVADGEDFIAVQFGSNCDGKNSNRSASVRVRLEASNDVVCTDS